MNPIFSEEFLSESADHIAETIRTEGIYVCERAVLPQAVDAIMAETGGLHFRINENTLLPVAFKGQTYQNQFIALSRTAFDLVCHDRITSISRASLGPKFAMVGKRLYETRSDSYMVFHSDLGAETRDPARVDGLGFILYMSDVTDGAFEIVEGTHRDGASYTGSREQDQALVRTRPIRAYPMPKGSYIIYNGRLIHRAQPLPADGAPRTSLHFQVNRDAAPGEPIYVNIGWLGDMSEDARQLLGFGVPNIIPHTYPVTTVRSIPKTHREAVAYIREELKHLIDR